jgi:hypothetical protein
VSNATQFRFDDNATNTRALVTARFNENDRGKSAGLFAYLFMADRVTEDRCRPA